MSDPVITAKRSFRDGCVSITFDGEAYGHGGAHIRAKAQADVTVQQARALAASLIDLADRAHKRAADLAARAARRRKWREREAAAGRLG